ncbi:hypothetical protein XENTR_v10005905 [Xenopus tropicalis]|uniref:E3 ubiquitin/ISG15 ligase TRIM25 n=1 Tax=Xenopus tropicalis TaxID=8364 RepID=F6TM72_XENTR|nr:E3 ubiquitin/ISG15 ligase TRIM25 [Xenopus tropicalis]KAE8624305.1 hypothetical protein XENTR_v10005905 [Xenopus tropicalis]|eukprot:XP_002941622.2 PREDICTED: E3 ubiquitin/ISG15 ligase TRIM25-like [Xenopus tropicalis]
MASAGLNDELTCSICLSIYKDPVMLPCGHNFCDHCIVHTMDSQTGSGIYTCPECRAVFKQRPSLQKNLKLSNIVERYLCTQPKETKSEVFCSYCIASPVLAVKTCLHCEASMCDMHLTTHSKSEKHVLIEPTAFKEEGNKCLIHNELLKYFCPQDSALICLSCSKEGKHHRHSWELISDAFEKKKTTLLDFLQKLNLRRTENQKQLSMLQERKKKEEGRASDMKERVAALFSDIREEVLALENKVINEIIRQEEKVSHPLADLIQRFEIEKADLYAKKCHIEKLCSVKDPLTLLKQPAITSDLGKKHLEVADISNFDGLTIDVTLQKGLSRLTDTIPKLKLSRGFYTEDESDMILNVNTADPNIALSPHLRRASYCQNEVSRPHHPERFMTQQVLSKNKFSSGQHYWEVKCANTGDWYIGVTYNSVKRKGDRSCMGNNYKSWCLRWEDQEFSADHDDESEDLYIEPSTFHFGIYLDYEGGCLSFYELSEPVKHLYSFKADFTEPLYAGFYIGEDSWIYIGK